MPPSSRKDRGRTKASDPKGRVRRGRPKVCIFCTEHIAWVDYKDMNLLRRFMSDRGKIKSRANTGTCSQHQSDVALAIKNARELALLPYAVRTLAGDKSAGRRGRGGPGGDPDRPAGPAAPTPPGSADAVRRRRRRRRQGRLGITDDDGGAGRSRRRRRGRHGHLERRSAGAEKVGHRPLTRRREVPASARNGSPLGQSCD